VRHGVWRSLVARFVRDEEVAGSNPVTPTIFVLLEPRAEKTSTAATVQKMAELLIKAEDALIAFMEQQEKCDRLYVKLPAGERNDAIFLFSGSFRSAFAAPPSCWGR
jgi:hypothetical protein